MFNDSVDLAPPPKLRTIIAENSWVFPTDYPVVDNTHSPDSTRTLKAVIAYSLTQHYYEHSICSYNIDYFTQRLSSRLYDKMAQHQYWIDQFLGLIDDNQFFYNEEWQDGGTQTDETLGRTTSSTTNNLSRVSDTPQSMVSDIDNYLATAQKDSGGDSGVESATRGTEYSTDLHTRKSTLGDITVQFRNFAEFPSFITQLTKAVSPCFIEYYGNDEIDYGTSE